MTVIQHCSPEVAEVIAFEIAAFERLSDRLRWPAEESGAFQPFEIQMVGTGHTSEELREMSDRLESLLLHTRVLREFFYYWEFRKDRAKRQKPDDVIAEDYISDWTSHRPPIGPYLRENKEQLDKSLAHLSTLRVQYKRTEKRWDIAALRRELLPVIETFRCILPRPMQPWFVLPADKF
jgi:hypothetical protein